MQELSTDLNTKITENEKKRSSEAKKLRADLFKMLNQRDKDMIAKENQHSEEIKRINTKFKDSEGKQKTLAD